MTLYSRSILILVLSCLLPACSEELTSEAHLNSAKRYLEQSNNGEAIVELKNALTKDVNNTRARAMLGRVYFDTGAFADAEKELSKALASGIDTSAVVPVLAEVLLSLGEYDKLDNLTLDGLDPLNRSTVLAAKSLAMVYRNDMVAAVETMEAALKNEPNSAYAQVAAARLAMAEGAYGDARVRLQALFKTSPTYAPAWNLLGDLESVERQPKKAEAAYSKVIKLADYSFDATLNRAMMRIYQQNWKGANDDLRLLKKRYPQARVHPGFHFASGILLLQMKRIDPAEKSFEQAIDFSHAYPLTLYYLSAISLEKGLVQQAISYIHRFLGLVHDSVVGAKLAARLELEQEGYAKAEELLLPILADRPDDPEALNLMASALLGQGRSGETVDLLARVAELQPDSAEARARLGAGFIAAGSEELGIATLRGILAKDPGYEQADILIVLNFLRQKDAEGALTAALDYRERNPASATSYNLLGRSYLASANLEQAKLEFKKALDLSPGDPGACHSLAEIEMNQGRYAAARKYYERVLKHYPAHMPSLMKVAASFAQEGNEQKMFDSLQRALAVNPRAMEPRLIQARYYIAKGQLDEVALLYDELTIEQRNHPDVLVTLAGFQLASGRYNQALVTLDRLSDTSTPNESQYHYMKSKAYAGLGDVQQLTSELQRAVELDPDHFYAKIALARLALLSRKSEIFEQRLEELKAVAPDNPDVMKLEAASAHQHGDNARAAKILRQVVERAPSSSNAIALAAHLQAVGNVDGAIVELQSWVANHSNDVAVREKLAELYGSVNRIGGVIYQYREILKVEPNHVIALNNVAWHLQEDDPVQALSLAEKAFALSPESAMILDTLAMTQMRTNNLVAARRSIDRALALAPKSLEMKFHEAQIRAREGDREGAAKRVEVLLRHNPKFSERAQAEAFLRRVQP